MSTGKIVIIISVLATVIILIGGVLLLSNQNSSSTQTESTTVLNSVVGKPAKDFTLEDYNGKKVTLSSFKGKNVVLFFSEGAMCYPACWNQIAAFAKDSKFADKNTVVLTIIDDSNSSWKQSIEKMPELAPATVLLDTDKRVSVDYNTLFLPSSMHKGLFPGHTYFLIDKEGIVRYVYDDPQMAVRDNQILAEIDKL